MTNTNSLCVCVLRRALPLKETGRVPNKLDLYRVIVFAKHRYPSLQLQLNWYINCSWWPFLQNQCVIWREWRGRRRTRSHTHLHTQNIIYINKLVEIKTMRYDKGEQEKQIHRFRNERRIEWTKIVAPFLRTLLSELQCRYLLFLLLLLVSAFSHVSFGHSVFNLLHSQCKRLMPLLVNK